MVDFENQTRKRCRHCQMNLPVPVSNAREAFCGRGCYGSFYRKRCVICEEPMERKNEGQKLCGKRKCRNTLQQLKKADFALGRYFPRRTSSGGVEVSVNTGVKTATAKGLAPALTLCFDGSPLDHCVDCGQDHDLVDHKTTAGTWITFCRDCQAKYRGRDLIAAEIVPARSEPWLPKGLAKPLPNGKPGWQWRRMSETSLDDDWELLDRDGKMAARIRQEGDGYWVTRPRMIPEPPIESFKAVCRRAVVVGMMTREWPESETHAVHPGMTALQFRATLRDWSREHPGLPDTEIEQRVIDVLKPPAIEFDPDRTDLIRNAIETEFGGHTWRKVISRDGVTCFVAETGGSRVSGQLVHFPAAGRAKSPELEIPDDLSIPPFLNRRLPPALKEDAA